MTKRPKRPRDPMQLARLVGDIAVGEVQEAPMPAPSPVSEARRRGGLKDGKARAKKLLPEKRKAFALRVTPAMEAGKADHVWSLEEIAGLAE